LGKWKDWERFAGKKVQVVLKEPAAPEQPKYFDGLIAGAANHSVTLELAGGRRITFPFEQVARAHLKFEW
jgi:ribosome maturation factor RimP